MNHKKTNTKFFTLLLLCAIVFSTNIHAATFPITQNFSGSKPSDWELRSDAVWNTTVSGDQAVRLTAAGTGQSGLAFYNDLFSSGLGIVTQIRYYSGGGTGADGFAFFLVDGDQVNESNIAAGAAGGALGYARNGTLTPGIPHAYMGVGFDEFGSFAIMNGSGQPQSPQSVVLRGGGNGTTGYDYLTKRNVATDFGQNIDGGWRLARITVLPVLGGSTVRVEMSWNEGATWLTVIDNYQYNVSMPTNLKLGFTGGTGAVTNIHAIGDLSVTVPADLQVSTTTIPSGTYKRGDVVTYSYRVLNAGPNDAGISTTTNSFPIGDSGFSDITWTAVTSTGTTTTGNGTNVSAIPVSLSNGVYVDVTVSMKIGKDVISTDDLYINLGATPGTGVSDPSPSTAQLAVSLSVDVPTPTIDADLDIIETYATSHGGSATPTVANYATASTTGVTTENLSAINAAVASYGAGAALNPQVLQGIIDGVIYILAHPAPVVVPRMAIGGGVIMGCKDSNASNYNYFSSHDQTLCTYTSAVTAAAVSATTSIRDLSLQMKGEDVVILQKLLISRNVGVNAKVLAKIGATGYYGNATKKAVIEFQKKNKISTTGTVGPLTRKAMMEI